MFLVCFVPSSHAIIKSSCHAVVNGCQKWCSCTPPIFTERKSTVKLTGLRVEIPRGVWIGEDWDVFHDLASLQHSFIDWICWMWTWATLLMQHSHSGTISHWILVEMFRRIHRETFLRLLYVCNDHVSFILHVDISSFAKDRRLQSPAL